MNTHLDNASEEARVNGAKLVREKILSFDMPVVCTGDFNVNEGSTVYNLMNDASLEIANISRRIRWRAVPTTIISQSL